MHFELISNLHKDARGFRPSSDWLRRFHAEPFAAQEAEWNALCRELEDTMEAEAEAEKQAIARFEARVSDLIATGARDRDTAIRWIADAEGVDLANDPQGAGFLEYLLGVPYGHINQQEAA